MTRLPPPDVPAFLRRSLPDDRYTVEVSGMPMHVMEVGHGRPVVLLHGNPTWGFLWRKVAVALRGAKLRLIMPDLVGLGFSHKPRSGQVHTLANHGRWLGELLDALSLEGVIAVVQDWGGPILLRALADRPGSLAGLVVLNTVLGPPKPGFKATAFHRFSNIPLVSDFAFRILGFPQIALHSVQGDRASIRGEVARAYRFPLRSRWENVAPLALARMVPDSMAHPSIAELAVVQALVESFEGPAAICWGERDPILGKLLRRTQRLLPQARVTTTRAGHFLQEEVPDDIADAIRYVAAQLV